MDGSDKKSLNNLMDHLKKLQESVVEKSGKNTKENNNGPSTSRKSTSPNKAPLPGSSRKRRKKSGDDHPKITSWLNKDSEKKLKPLDVNVNKEKSKSKKTKLERNPSFEKYGVVMPSFEKIKADQKKFDEHKNLVKAFDTFDDELLQKELKIDCLDEAKEYTGELLDCKHLSLDELHEAFQNHSTTLKNILDGKKYSERHQRFHNYDIKYDFTNKDLRCSTSSVVFSQEQKDYLLDLMREEFDPEDKKTNYFFKVLLPELCLYIFMDTHNMNKRQANKYLDERPLDI